MTKTFEVPKRVRENQARRHAADQGGRCLYQCRARARLYPCGWRCDEHSPWALAGRPNPDSLIDPTRTLEALRAAAGTDAMHAPSQTVLDTRNREAGRTVSPERRRNAHDGADTLNLTDRFRAFHQKNPHVYTRLEELVAEAVTGGHKRIGVGALFERLRYSERTETNGDHYRLNNDYRADYVRLLVARHPEWADVFELRERKAS